MLDDEQREGFYERTNGRSTTTTIAPQLRRFHGSVKLDPQRLVRDASKITDGVVQHLSSVVGADVQVTLDIQAELPTNASDKLVRDVTENCRTLKCDEEPDRKRMMAYPQKPTRKPT